MICVYVYSPYSFLRLNVLSGISGKRTSALGCTGSRLQTALENSGTSLNSHQLCT